MSSARLPLSVSLLLASFALAQCASPGAEAPASGPSGLGLPPSHQQVDEATRYELLEPSGHAFRITHELSARQPGLQTVFQLVRGGIFVSDASALDLYSGAKLSVALVGGEDARRAGFEGADPGATYFAVPLDRAVPENGIVRVRLAVTYEDAASYQFSGDEILFDRPLLVKRIAVVLPAGYQVAGCNFPVQVGLEGDGRVRVSYLNPIDGPVMLRVLGRKLPAGVDLTAAATPEPSWEEGSTRAVAPAAARAATFASRDERWREDDQDVRWLELGAQPSVRSWMERTGPSGEDAPQIALRARAQTQLDLRAVLLDTGEALQVRSARDGDQVSARAVLPDDETPRAHRVRYEAALRTASWLDAHGRVAYREEFAGPRLTVHLPPRAVLTSCSVPATLDTAPDGHAIVKFTNATPEAVVYEIGAVVAPR